MIPYLDLKAQVAAIRPEVEAALGRVLDTAQFVLGDAVADFETGFAAYCGTRHAVAVNSGTSALHLALLAHGIGPGDEVVVPAMTFVASAAAVAYTGATPVLADVDPVTWTLDPAAAEAAVTPRTRAIMPVHLHGLCADMDAIGALARSRGLAVIEDAAQSHGAAYRGTRAGALGDIGCFSFYPGKNLGAFGEGGAVVTDSDDAARTIRQLRDWGQTARYRHERLGFNYRMDGFQGAVLGVKMNHIEAWTEARRVLAARYHAALAASAIGMPRPPDDRRHVYHVYAVRVRDRDAVQTALNDAGIGTNIHYPVPVHRQPAFAGLGHGPGAFPVTEDLAAQFLSLPLYPELAAASVDQVAETLLAVAGNERVQEVS